MLFLVGDTYREITLRAWNGSTYEPDCFSDLEVCVPSMYAREPGGNAFVLTAQEFADLLDFWTEEVRCMNEHIPGQCSDYSDDYSDSDDTKEMVLFTDETESL